MESVSMRRYDHWLLIAQEDLDSAKHLFSREFTTTLFHAQQCAEKALKAYLSFKNKPIIKTHDLIKLVNSCLECDYHFETLRPLAADLTPYETAGRYPEDSFEKPTKEDIEELLEQAEDVFTFVVTNIKTTQK